MNEELYQLVAEAYQTAMENGYDLDDLDTWSDLDVADDMQNYDDDIAPYAIEDILECVKHFRKQAEGRSPPPEML